jgi:hypothetical protein
MRSRFLLTVTPLFALALGACAAPVDEEPLACAGERAKFCGPEGTEVSPPPPAPEGPIGQSDPLPARSANDAPRPHAAAFAPASEALRLGAVLPPR